MEKHYKVKRIDYMNDELAHAGRHKYIDRVWSNGRWRYIYDKPVNAINKFKSDADKMATIINRKSEAEKALDNFKSILNKKPEDKPNNKPNAIDAFKSDVDEMVKEGQKNKPKAEKALDDFKSILNKKSKDKPNNKPNAMDAFKSDVDEMVKEGQKNKPKAEKALDDFKSILNKKSEDKPTGRKKPLTQNNTQAVKKKVGVGKELAERLLSRNSRPTGRKRHITGPGKPIKRRGSGLNGR